MRRDSQPARGPSAAAALWEWADLRKGHRLTWEVKTGTPNAVPRGWVNQALGQIMEERQRHPRAIITGCLLTDLAEAEQDARRAARDDVAILHTDTVLAIYDRVAGLLSQYLAAWGGGTARERGEARSTVEPQLPQPGWLARLLSPNKGDVMRDARAVSLLLPGR